MYDEREQSPEHGPLAGFTVGVTAARRADELGALLERRGAAVLHAPALRIVPLSDDSELLAATKEIIGRAPDIAVATTAIGFRGWVEAADGWGLGEDLVERLREVRILARGGCRGDLGAITGELLHEGRPFRLAREHIENGMRGRRREGHPRRQ